MRGVESLEVVGNITLPAFENRTTIRRVGLGEHPADGETDERLAVISFRGILGASDPAALRVGASGTVHITTLAANKLAKDLDCASNAMHNVAIQSGTLTVKSATITGPLHLASKSVLSAGEGALALFGSEGVVTTAKGLVFTTGSAAAMDTGDGGDGDGDDDKPTDSSGAELHVPASVMVGGSLHVQHDGFVSGSLVVSGTVMGSGSYVDSSDVRFKRDLRPLAGAPLARVLSNLSAYTYDYDRAAFPERNFPDGRDVGFVAQEVEALSEANALPKGLVRTDKDGYK